MFGGNNIAEAAGSDSVKVVLSKPKLSKPLTTVAKPLPEVTNARKYKLRQSGEKVPGYDLIREVPNQNHPFADELLLRNTDFDKDPVLQKSQKHDKFSPLLPSIGTGFDGMGNVTGAVPPDTVADVGPNHVVQMVNTALAIWDKEGNQLAGPIAINQLWSGFGGLCESTNRGDPIVLYDSAADRWMLSQFAFTDGFTDNRECIAISQTNDPTGAYYLYDFAYSTTKFNDYPHFGVWTDAYYMGVNQFQAPNLNYAGAGVVAYERDKMLAGQPAQQVIIDLQNLYPNAFTPMPADIDGTYLPPEGMPGYFVTSGATPNTMDVYTFDVDWNTPENSSFSLKNSVPVAEYNGGICSYARDCITQPNAQKLDAIGERMMFRLAYRLLDGTDHKLVANHNVVGSDTDDNIAGVRWYEFDLDPVTGQASVANQGTFNLADGNSRWMGSAAMDAAGNIGVAYSVSGPSTNPSIRFSGRYADDPADTLTVPEQELKAGGGAQAGANRWGDYSSLSVDPEDDCTFWYTTEYYKAENDNSSAWSTYIGSFKFDNCVAGPKGYIEGTVTDNSGNPIAGAKVSAGAATVVTDESGNYTMTLPAGSIYDLGFSKYGYIAGSVNNIDLAEDEVEDVDIVLDNAEAITISGTVADGSGLGTPLYAEVMIKAPGATITTFTDPVTGQYSIDAYEGTLVKIQASSIDPGYLEQSYDILPENTPVQNFDLQIDSNCTAQGYIWNTFFEGFDSGVPPAGWTVEDISGSGMQWQAASTAPKGNLLNVSGEAAAIDSDAAGTNNLVSSVLVSPTIYVADIESTTLNFASLFRTFGYSDVYTVDISVDGGEWTAVHTFNPTNMVETISVDLSAQLAGATSFKIRFAYEADYEYYAYIDNVTFGTPSCIASSGSYQSGYVVDANTQLPIIGAQVTSGNSTATTVATVDNEQLEDGFFRIFIGSGGTAEAEVTASNYKTVTVDLSGYGLSQPIALDAGLLELGAADFEVAEGLDRTVTAQLENLGNADANYELSLYITRDDSPVAKPYGIFHQATRRFGPKALQEMDTKKIRYRSMAPSVPEVEVEFVSQFPTELTLGWGIGFDKTTSEIWVGDVTAGGAPLDALHKYVDGIKTGHFIDTSAVTVGYAADLAYNARTNTFWQVAVTGDTCIHEIDTVAGTVTGNKICPTFGTSQRGLAYDPISGTFYAGSWNDSVVHQFDAEGNILRSINVDLAVSGLALNPVTNHLFVMSNDAAGSIEPDIVVLDASTPELDPIGLIYVPSVDTDGDDVAEDLMDGGQAGLAIDCDGNLWAVNQSRQTVVGITSGETGVCDITPTWVELKADSGSIGANQAGELELDVSTKSLSVGNYSAQLIMTNDTPYGSIVKPVNLTVREPQYGQLGVSGNSGAIRNGGDIQVTVSRVDGSDYQVSVDYTTVNGTANSGTHYTAASGTLTWADGDTEDKVITISTIDTDQSSDLNFSVELSNPEKAQLGTSQVNLTIQKDPPKRGGGGSAGFAILALLALAGLARRRKYLS
ncbi:PKD domain-containing protein [Kangiella profundi]|uniref:PKD domain-containing protein n=2 Tax=Kangiella profundi TaxID=1561924 RepID=A0A2K9ANL2_9GAMM|nr:PKD domain-containing protein [Kangiella profundi]